MDQDNIQTQENSAPETVVVENAEKNNNAVIEANVAKNAKEPKPAKKEKTKKKKEKQPSKVGKMVKDTTSELKKVTWPTFAQVVKRTGVVLAVVLVFAVVMFGIDRLLGWLYSLLINLVA